MLSATEIIAEVERRGGRFEVIGNKLRATPKSSFPDLTAPIISRKPEIINVLLGRQQAPLDRDLEISRAIRSRTYSLPEPPICAFLVGAAGDTCRRCGGSWVEHYEREGAERGVTAQAASRSPGSTRPVCAGSETP